MMWTKHNGELKEQMELFKLLHLFLKLIILFSYTLMTELHLVRMHSI